MTAPSSTTAEVAAERLCAACQHLWTTHDDISARFCAATIVNTYSRGCVCVPGATTGTTDAAN
ncbi:RGCVC family protein [Actinophytocola glycyrrhizae]|uniref:RGCVC family protein n=1 Tax=Actinophytocola glycyrrhizae TaxID=2044873 RepID=A0ABV9RUQ9_9PSEU